MLGVVALVALAAAVVMTAMSGARRTETAYGRFLDWSRSAEVTVSAADEGYDYSALRNIDGVAEVAEIVGLELYPAQEAAPGDVLAVGSVDGTHGWEIERPKVIDGRMADREADDEILVNRIYAEAFRVEPGDRVSLVAETDLTAVERALRDGDGITTFEVTITGVGVIASDLVPESALEENPAILVPPRLVARVLDAELGITGFDGAGLDLETGASPEAVIAAVLATSDAEVFILEEATSHATVKRALRPQATAVWVFAGLASLASVLLVGNVISRHVASGSARVASLRAVGVARSTLLTSIALEGLVLGACAALAAAGLATLASPLFPVGRVRLAEPSPGLALNVSILASVSAVVMVCMTAVAAVTAWRLHRTESDSPSQTRTSRLASVAARAGARPPVVLGVRRAFEPRVGGDTVPVRSGLLGAAIAVAGVVAAATFATGLDELVSDRTRFGQTWSVAFDAQFGPVPAGDLVERYADDERVAALAGLVYSETKIDGRPVPTVGFDVLRGELGPRVVEGRAPAAADEIVLGGQTLSELGLDIGDTVVLDSGLGPMEAVVVGQAVFPKLSKGSFNVLGLGQGALMPAATLPNQYERAYLQEGAEAGDLPPEFEVDDFLVGEQSYNAVLFDLVDDDDRSLVDELAEHPILDYEFATVFEEQRPSAISTYSEIRGIPAVLAALLAALGAVFVAHVLITSVRRGRVELGICRALGMRARDLSSIVRWQATAVAVVGLAVGIPVGLAGGRTAWRLFAGELGVPPAADIPWGWMALVALATLAVTNLAALTPARRARTQPAAAVVRAE